ncbi:sin3 histone deacetylase corepressor complex component SDS3 [Drosophila nasuta]|uniref:Sin3 histone deacetylase corepressor complex component SDS3 n=1 Tax=Drosophila albomicans TaxID=7291 RepID=A0A6P8Y7Q3_DROAB|nr:sin3 histone deacetylase corepressor complex component SDS3 [Drosophila albomicans]XP_060664302.1 sin3 histone deacetylase corepressor complex component SDS3 [Drosophila nasuta]
MNAYYTVYSGDNFDDESIGDERSEEDTDDASETEFRSPNRYGNTNGTSSNSNNNNSSGNNNSNNNSIGSNSELKEQMYQHKLINLQKQLDELNQLMHPEYMKRVRKLDNQLKERRRLNEIYKDYMRECVERDYILEKKAAQKEYDEKMMDLKDNLIADFEDRKRQIENERYSLELTNDSMEIKTTVTRKLRRRPNEPLPVIEKRRKPATGQLLIYQLDDKEIESDLKMIQRGKPLPLQQNGMGSYSNSQQQQQQQQHNLLAEANSYVETRIEDNKLLYERRWFCRGQQIYVEGKDMNKFPATITAIGNEVIWVKRSNESKFKINMSHLAKGKISIKRR